MKYISLTGKYGKGEFTIVDDEDYEYLNQRKWWCDSQGYAKRCTSNKGVRRILYLHILIHNTPKGMHTDHINGDRLDNRRSNLRSATPSQNRSNSKKPVTNTLGYKGLTYLKSINRYRVNISAESKRLYIGVYKTVEEAAQAYNEAAIKYHGEFARLNVIKS